MSIIEIFQARNHAPFPAREPGYWSHRLLRHLKLPSSLPGDWNALEPRQRFFVALLEAFSPPANLLGLKHQLPAFQLVALGTVPERLRPTIAELLDDFSEHVHDFIRHEATDEERKILSSRRLRNLTHLGIWRFHFHCAQADPFWIKQIFLSHATRELIDTQSISYLQENRLNPLYRAIGVELHYCLRRRLRDKLQHHHRENWNDRLALIYNESLLCERALLSAHLFLETQGDEDPATLRRKLQDLFRRFGNLKTIELDAARRKAPTPLDGCIPYLARVHHFLSRFGAYRPTGARTKRRRRSWRPGSRRYASLLPPGSFPEEDEGFEAGIEADLDEAMEVLAGVPDDRFVSANLRRSFGLRPGLAREIGESEADYTGPDHIEIPASWVADPFQQSLKQRVQRESLILAPCPPVWSPPVLMVQTLKRYIELAERAPAPVQCLALMGLYTGLSVRDLKAMRVGMPAWLKEASEQGLAALAPARLEEIQRKREEGLVYLDPESHSYAYSLSDDQVAYYGEPSPEFAVNCLPASFVVRILLPAPVEAALRRWQQSDPRHFAPEPEDPKPLFARRHLNRWTELMAEAGRLGTENVTPIRLQSTFRSLFEGQMGLGALDTDLIARQIPVQRRAQHFYAAVDLSRLNSAYLQAAERVHRTLAGASAPPGTGPAKAGPSLGYAGSRIVPKREALATYFSELQASFMPALESGRLDSASWNRLMLFLYRLLQAGTGIRPMRDGLPGWSCFFLQLGWMHVADKDNLHFFESRLIPLPTLPHMWLGWLHANLPRSLLALNLATSKLTPAKSARISDDLFILATDDGQARPMTMKDLQTIEENRPGTSPWTWKANALRHYLVTTLVNQGVDQRIIDMITGHKHFGTEPFGRYSLAKPSALADSARLAIDRHVLKPLGILLPPDRP